MKTGTLFLIPSVLHEENASVISPEALEIIFSLKHFVVENDKTARRFLKLVKYPHPQQSVHMNILDEHTQDSDLAGLLHPLAEGINVGLLSEAGSPAVADPGSNLVRMAHEKGIPVKPLSGPSSVLLALMGSGLNGQNFAFSGYLPKERSARIKVIKDLERICLSKNQTQIFIETPYRVQHVFDDLLSHLHAETLLSIASELTATDEFIHTMPVGEWKKKKVNLQKKQVVFLIGR